MADPSTRPRGPSGLAAARLTVRVVIDWYRANELRDLCPKAQKERERLWQRFAALYGELTLEECRPYHLRAFLTAETGARSNHTRRRFKTTICRPFNAAEHDGLGWNPFRGLKVPPGPEGRDWTPAEYRAILRRSPAHFRRLLIFLRFGGARPGEARDTTWPDVRDEFEAVILARHKTDHIVPEPRRIYFNHVIARLLLWLARQPRRHPRYLFTNSFGQPWTPRALDKFFAAVRRRAGLKPDVKLHGARHTFATWGLMNGVDLAEMQQLLGHKSIQSTMRYVHLLHKRAHLNAAANRAIGRKPTA